MFGGGPVTIAVWPGVEHCVVFGAVFTQSGLAVAKGANVTAQATPAIAKVVARLQR